MQYKFINFISKYTKLILGFKEKVAKEPPEIKDKIRAKSNNVNIADSLLNRQIKYGFKALSLNRI